ncbi:hypothetical protein VTP01DRAFT_8238 [Rhizomucor pusillus]|uniref:uncharacterized protein n=1 Tax=Rhizomucor pusillus TaxID=4840 RepID=UPI0037424798
MAQGYSSVPQEENSAGTNQPGRLRRWWEHAVGSKGERAPLIDRQSMTLQPPRRTWIKNALIVIAIILVLAGLGGLIAYFIKGSDDGQLWPGKDQILHAEKLVLDLPDNENIRGYLKHYTSVAHLAGTESDRSQAEWTRDKFIEFGIANTTIKTYYPLLNYPVKHRLAIVSGPEELRYEAELREDVVDEDETSKDPDNVPTFHGYSKNGTATGPVVYANYGRVEDFQYLVDQGVNLTGTIALMRYGGAFRGLKVRAAEKFGCAGALIYSDPIDDGPINKEGYPYVNPAKSYPEGPWRSPSSVQRGSVQYLSLTTGDPLTPGYAATKDAPRLDRDEVHGLAKIPSLPISWRDALPLLKATQGHGVRGENDWAGGLEEVDYYSGPSEGDVNLVNIIDEKITPIWDVIGVIEGAVDPDSVIVLGNHRDAWVYGAVDPSSGSATLLELVRVFGELLKTGWRPARTILFASWDAEEYGLVGSTEWVEDNRDWLREKAVVYINVDVAVSGPHFQAAASPSLSNLIYEVTSSIQDPRTGKTVYEAWSEFTNRTGTPSPKPTVRNLGSGSDFVPFLDHLGIASISMEFEGDYGVYHSNYDSFHWMEKFGDPDFYYHQTLTKIWGLMTLRLSDSVILPISPNDYAEALDGYVDELSAYSAQSKDFSLLKESIGKLSDAASHFEKRRARLDAKVQKFVDDNEKLPAKVARRVARTNKRLTYFERGFVDPEGIKDRTWFKHVVYAPGLWTGYDSQVFPAIVDALDSGDDDLVKHTEERASLSIDKARDWLSTK